jgi:hypothetical protein
VVSFMLFWGVGFAALGWLVFKNRRADVKATGHFASDLRHIQQQLEVLIAESRQLSAEI